ncbi:amidase [Paraburkholderia acidiphila]|uniref:Amidase n=1 Tax=Paraburkholderia acidiphila TaxID=2571747 RepID=A0A7Z2JAX7_9BURK|nr:amidase family protein [Paraburkholderia acidiphila]QGZ56375.1 amidase [Paraburkholderia acidiphila]
MRDYEYLELDGVALSELLAKGETSSDALLTCAISIAKHVNPALNAICYPDYEASMALARNGSRGGVFRGIPFLLKDSGLASARLDSKLGSSLFDSIKYAADSTLVARFEDAGLIPFARTTVPELCMAPTTEATQNGGPTRNPHDFSRSAGGSSGGAAAAVAAGIVPVAHGSDGAGSIRIPASCCGVFGLKPSRGRVPMGPYRGEGWAGLAVDGVISRTVRDTAAVLDAVSGFEPGAPYCAPPLSRPLTDVVNKPFDRPLRIAVWKEPLNGIALAPECAAAVDATAQLLRDLGHEVEYLPAPSGLDYESFVADHIRVLAANIVLSVDARLNMLGRRLRDGDLEPAILDGYELGKSVPASQYAAAVARFHSLGRLLDVPFERFDIVLTSTLAQLPAELGTLTMNGTFTVLREKVSRYSTYLAILNASGQPAASVPTYWTEHGLPVGSQLIGRYGREDLIVQLASQLESTGSWQPARRRPQFNA